MAIDSDIRDQAYQFFIQEAPELLQIIEAELLTLRQDRNTAKVHNLMRAAHSIKGGAANVGLDTIKLLSHRLEDIFKALHHQTLEIDASLENSLLQAYDCLRLPLMEEITLGQFDNEAASAAAEPIFTALETRLAAYLGEAASLPSSIELGVDIALSIFEVDISQGLERLETVLSEGQNDLMAAELRAQAQVFIGIAELLSLPGFEAIAQAAVAALEVHPQAALEITQLALSDFRNAQKAVVAGDRIQGGSPSDKLIHFTHLHTVPEFTASADSVQEVQSFSSVGVTESTSLSNLEAIWGDEVSALPLLDDIWHDSETDSPIDALKTDQIEFPSTDQEATSHETSWRSEPELQEWVQSVEQIFDHLPPIKTAIACAENRPSESESLNSAIGERAIASIAFKQNQKARQAAATPDGAQLSVRVNLERLERMNNVVGEFTINRNTLSLQHEQLQKALQELLRRFSRFQEMGTHLRDLSDQMLVMPHYSNSQARQSKLITSETQPTGAQLSWLDQTNFDSLELDSYGELHLLLQTTLEEMAQLEEVVGDITLLAGQSGRTLEAQHRMLNHLRDDLMWARMLPLSEILNRFPRTLRDLSAAHHKLVDLKLTGTGVLVDKAVVEKLYDPLLHLLRNGFDHGIESPDVRRQQGKQEQGQMEIRAYHQGSQTVIEVRDDGQGINFERVRKQAVSSGLMTPNQAIAASTAQLLEIIFEPGFSTAARVSDLSGRGVGLDVVRSQLQALKGTVTVTSELGQGTIFTLRIPLTLSIAKLLVCAIGSTALAFPSDGLEEIVVPKIGQTKHSSGQHFLHWRDRLIPVYQLSSLLEYAYPQAETVHEQVSEALPTPKDWASPLLLFRRDNDVIALEVDRLVTEQELVIKPFGAALTPPDYIYGCTILGNGELVPVLDSAVLSNRIHRTNHHLQPSRVESLPAAPLALSAAASIHPAAITASPILLVDDSVGLRQTLALTLQKAGYRILQARDGREAIKQLEQNSTIQLIVCDIEMPNMNGFEFLSHRRQTPDLLTIPIVMLTSRSSDKHRRLAMQLGATAYLTKPYLEQDLLATFAQILASQQTAYPSTATR